MHVRGNLMDDHFLLQKTKLDKSQSVYSTVFPLCIPCVFPVYLMCTGKLFIESLGIHCALSMYCVYHVFRITGYNYIV